MASSRNPRTSSVLPVIEEQVRVGKQTEEKGALRVRVVVRQTAQSVELTGASEEVSFERVPVGRTARQRQPPWTEGDVLVVPVYEEIATVRRRLVLKEVIRVHTMRKAWAKVVEVPLKKQTPIVERSGPDGTWVPADTGTAIQGGELAGEGPGPRSGSTVPKDRSQT